jgi:putative pantetheine hydrolase
MTAGARNAHTDVPGIHVGHATRIGAGALSGTTVVLVPPESTCAVDVRGGAPSTRETAALDPRYGVRHPDAIVLTGGSSYGLATAHGVLTALGGDRLVPAAAVFDLGRGGDFHAHPGPGVGVEALLAAASAAEHAPVAQGNVGAGTGAVNAGMKGGLGTASSVLPGGTVVAALVAMNAQGPSISPADGLPYGHGLGVSTRYRGGEVVAWQEFPLTPPDKDELLAGRRVLEETVRGRPVRMPANTVIGVIATNAPLGHAQAQRLAGAAQDGLALAIRPSHRMGDGDTIFAVSPGSSHPDNELVDAVLATAADVTARALVHSMLTAESVTTPWGRIAAYRELYPKTVVAYGSLAATWQSS